MDDRSEAQYNVAKVEWRGDREAQQAMKSILFDSEHPKLGGATLDTGSNRRYAQYLIALK